MFRKYGIRFGSLFGIPVILDPSWFLMLGLSIWIIRDQIITETADESAFAFVAALATAILTFASLIFHELGHALAARAFGIKPTHISINLFDGLAHLRGHLKTPVQEFCVAAGGPAASLILAGIFGAPLLSSTVSNLAVLSFIFSWLATVNLFVAIINIVIIGLPMDGGYMLRAVIWKATGNHLWATRAAAISGKVFGMLICAFGMMRVFTGDFSGLIYIFPGLVVARLARVAYQGAAFDHAFKTFKIRDLMRPVQVVVPAHLSIREVVRNFISRIHADQFPVIRQSELLGFISADDVAALDKSRWETTTAESLTHAYPPENFLSAASSALAGYRKLAETGLSALPVFDGRQLCGFLFLRDVQRRLEHHARFMGEEMRADVPVAAPL